MDNKFEIQEVIEQAATFDGKFKLAIDPYLLMKIVNHNGGDDDEEISEMKNPKKFVTRVIIETREI